jgi:hypothetical protein
MRNGQAFNYSQPTCDTLAGVYVETSDQVVVDGEAVGGDVQVAPVIQAEPRPEDLFGFTLSVDDSIAAEQSGRIAATAGSVGSGNRRLHPSRRYLDAAWAG